MNTQDQVSSLELSIKLANLGFKKIESVFYWDTKFSKIVFSSIHRLDNPGFVMDWLMDPGRYVSAYTVAELGKLLPDCVDDGKNFFHFYLIKNRTYFKIEYISDLRSLLHVEIGKSMADCFAKMLIYLIESRLMQVAK